MEHIEADGKQSRGVEQDNLIRYATLRSLSFGSEVPDPASVCYILRRCHHHRDDWQVVQDPLGSCWLVMTLDIISSRVQPHSWISQLMCFQMCTTAIEHSSKAFYPMAFSNSLFSTLPSRTPGAGVRAIDCHHTLARPPCSVPWMRSCENMYWCHPLNTTREGRGRAKARKRGSDV